jgi:molecular chaperone GrpE
MKEQSETAERAAAGLVSRLLAVLDNFDLAVAAAEETADFDRMRKGVEMVFGEFKEVLAGEGLESINAKGQKFDPTVHEAALEVGEGDGDPVVAEVLRPGYYLKGRVLRPAMVKIIRGGSTYQDGDSKD